MQVETDFTSRVHTLSFESKKRITLTKEESREFDKWFSEKTAEQQSK